METLNIVMEANKQNKTLIFKCFIDGHSGTTNSDDKHKLLKVLL